jgi:hypothetical protein
MTGVAEHVRDADDAPQAHHGGSNAAMKIATSTLIALSLLLGGCDDKKAEPAKQTDSKAKAPEKKEEPKAAAPMVNKEAEPEPAEVVDEPAGNEPPPQDSDVGEDPAKADKKAPGDEEPPE